MVDWSSVWASVLSVLGAPLTIVVVGVVLSGLLAYYVTARLYRPQKVFEAKQRIYPAIVGALLEFRRDVPKVQYAMRAFHGPIKVPGVTGLSPEEAGKAVMDAVIPRLDYSFRVLESITEIDPGSELAARVAVLAGDIGTDHQMELLYHLYGAFMTATARATRVLSESVAELWMFEHPATLVQLINGVFQEAEKATGITVSSGGKGELDWRRFDAGIVAIQTAISKDMGRSPKLWASSPGISLSDLGLPKDLRGSGIAAADNRSEPSSPPCSSVDGHEGDRSGNRT